MKIKPLVKDFIVPEYKREYSGGMDIYLQQDVTLNVGSDNVINLGFAIALRNTVGIIDADYRGEWIAHITLDSICDKPIAYKRGERLLQAVIVPFNKVEIELSDTLSQTGRGDTGFGGTGK